MPGDGYPRLCRALPEGEKRGGSGIWVGARELARKPEE
jgi:hypothetical protein